MLKKQKGAALFSYQPVGRALDIEVFHVSDLRQRTTPEEIRAPHRYNFHLLICVTRGQVTQWVDFQPVHCAPGSLLMLRPGQVHRLGDAQDWEGWMVLFRSEFLPPEVHTTADLLPVLGLDRLPEHMKLTPQDFDATNEAIARMRQDATRAASSQDTHALLRYQLYALLVRLCLMQDQEVGAHAAKSQALQRFAKFRRLVEQHYASWHHVATYADALGCTEKSLTRAAQEAGGKSAKSFITARIALEAKRLLAHTDKPIYLIAEGLGFIEATNFAKFFKRETGTTPIGFRKGYKA
jgi:AraC-like DNA-binding protein